MNNENLSVEWDWERNAKARSENRGGEAISRFGTEEKAKTHKAEGRMATGNSLEERSAGLHPCRRNTVDVQYGV